MRELQHVAGQRNFPCSHRVKGEMVQARARLPKMVGRFPRECRLCGKRYSLVVTASENGGGLVAKWETEEEVIAEMIRLGAQLPASPYPDCIVIGPPNVATWDEGGQGQDANLSRWQGGNVLFEGTVKRARVSDSGSSTPNV